MGRDVLSIEVVPVSIFHVHLVKENTVYNLSSYSRGSGRGKVHSHRPQYTGKSGRSNTPRRQSISPSRSELLERQKNGLCLTCGSRNHRAAACPRKNKFRSKYDSRRSMSPSQKEKGNRVNFRVSEIQDDPPTSDREGDVVDEDDEEVVDAYLAVRAMKGYTSEGSNAQYYEYDQE
jgi:hypothetical protein